MWPPLTTSASTGNCSSRLPFCRSSSKHGMDVAFEVIDADERLVQRVGQRLGVAQADQQRSRKSGALGDGQSVDRFVGLAGILQRLANDGNDGAQMLARRQFRYDAAVRLMGGDLRIDDIRDHLLAGADDRGCGLVAGALDAEDEDVGHYFIVRVQTGALRYSAISRPG